MCAEDPSTTTSEGKYHGKFWFTVGGEIEKGETLEEAAVRELYEETGLKRSDVTFGPLVWYGEFELVVSGRLSLLKQQFIVAKTTESKVDLTNLTRAEKAVIKKLEWFSYEKIKNSPEIIYPILLPKYLPDILDGKYPKEPLEIDLGIDP